MDMNRTIISVSGYGATGSSAVVDLLKGYDEIDVLDDFEFQLHYFPDAISDLDYKLNETCSRFYDSDLAIKRFLDLCKRLDKWYYPAYSGHLHEMAEEYINDLNPVTWDGYWAYDRLMTPEEHIIKVNEENDKIDKRNAQTHLVNRVLRKLHLPLFDDKKPHKKYFNERKMYICIKPQNFIEATQKFTDRLIMQASHKDADIIAINQLLPPQNPERFNKYFSEKVKTIVVTRDPRDLWLHIKNLNQSSYMPHKNVSEFIEWYKVNMDERYNSSNESVLRIAFEDLIYETESTVNTLYSFIGINSPEYRSRFDPHKSVINTQLFKSNPDHQMDIDIIEQELPMYLYDFDAHSEVYPITGIHQF